MPAFSLQYLLAEQDVGEAVQDNLFQDGNVLDSVSRAGSLVWDVRYMDNRVLRYLNEIALHDRRADFVLKYGAAFGGAPLPAMYRHGQMGSCYKNSALMSIRHGLTYVEGFASTNWHHTPTLHAWCVDRDGNVLDRTWSFTGENAYFGVPINGDYIKRMHKKSGYYGVIDLWEFDFPIYTEEPAVFLTNWQ